jgi:transposase
LRRNLAEYAEKTVAGHRDSEMMTARTGRRDLEGWLAVVEADDQSGLRSFAAGIRNDMPAVINGLTLHYSSATMEGNASKIILSNQNCQIDPEGLHATRSRVPG